MAIALPYPVALAQQVPADLLACHIKADGGALLPVHEAAVGPSAVLGTACVRVDTALAGYVAFQPHSAFVVPRVSELPAQGVDTRPCHATSTSGRKRAAEAQLLHPAASKQRRTLPHSYTQRPTQHTCNPRWSAMSPVQIMSAPADCCSASCPSATSTGTSATTATVSLQPTLLQYPHLTVLHLAPPHASCHIPTPTYSSAPLHHHHHHQGPHYAWLPSATAPHAPHDPQCNKAEVSSLSQHSHSLRFTPPQTSPRTSITSWPAAAAAQPSLWGPSPPPQASLWHPSPTSSTCSASSWIPAAAPSTSSLAQPHPLCPPPLPQYPHPQQPHLHPLPQHPSHPQQPHPCHHLQHPHPQLQSLPHILPQHHPQHLDAAATTTILCQLSVAPVPHPPQPAPCQPQSLLPPPHAAAQPPPLPPSVAWYSDDNSPGALLEANAFMAAISLPGNVEFLQVAAGSAMHRLGVLCSVSAASICLAQSYYLRLRHCMPLLQGALRVLSSLPRASVQTGAAAASRSHAESVVTGVKFTCVTLAAKMLEARSGQQKQLRGLLAQLTASTMAPTDTVAIEVRVLQHLDWRLGPYFLPPASECDDQCWQ